MLCGQAIINEPNQWLFYALGMIESDCRRWADAITHFTNAIALDNQTERFYLRRGDAYLAQSQLQQAIDDYGRAIQVSPECEKECIRRRGMAYKRLGRLEDALADFELALALKPDDFRSHAWRGGVLSAMGLLNESLASLNRAIELAPSNSDYYWRRGNLWCDLHDNERAKCDYNQAIELNPNNWLAHSELAHLFFSFGDPSQRDLDLAITHAKRACELTEWKEAGCLSILADASAEAGDAARALEWHEAALTHSLPEDFSLYHDKLERARRRHRG